MLNNACHLDSPKQINIMKPTGRLTEICQLLRHILLQFIAPPGTRTAANHGIVSINNTQSSMQTIERKVKNAYKGRHGDCSHQAAQEECEADDRHIEAAAVRPSRLEVVEQDAYQGYRPGKCPSRDAQQTPQESA